jgi:hypothetical protein
MMDLPSVFADIAAGFAGVTGAPYIDAVAVWPGEAVRDDGGSIVQPGVPDRRACKVQFDTATEAMRQANGFIETDARLIVLKFERALDEQAKVHVAEGPRAGTWSLLSVDPDPALIGYVCRARRQ